MSKKNKKVEKVSKETTVSKEDLNRLPVEALDKLDDMTPDEDIDIFEGTELQEGEESQEVPADSGSEESGGDETPGTTSVDNAGGVVSEGSGHDIDKPELPGEKVLVGYHPITKEPVYI